MTRYPRLGAIVEGHGEVQAVPVLVRRIALEIYGQPVDVQQPHRLPRSKICMPVEIERALRLQVARVGLDGGVLVVFDADDDDPEKVSAVVESVATDLQGRVAVAVAVKEFEAWFLAALPSLVSHRDVCSDATYARDPELRRDCKRELEHLMTESYSETRHQAAFAAIMDLPTARSNSSSFDRLVRAIGRLVGASED